MIIAFVLVASILLISNLEFSDASHFADNVFLKKYQKELKENKILKEEILVLNELLDIQEKQYRDYYDQVMKGKDLLEKYFKEEEAQREKALIDSRVAKTEIKGAEIEWLFYDSKGNEYIWSMPIVTYENQIVSSRELSSYYEYNKPKHLITNDGKEITTVNYEGFVKKSFGNVIDNVYDNSDDNSDFIWEVWYIVSKLTKYDLDVNQHSEGRFALETLSRGGGDCEDLTILIIDMLKSSSHTKDWTIELWYMDIDNPTDPTTVNHTIVYVNDGEYSYYIEATANEPSWDYYPDGVSGWSFDI